MPSSRRGRFAAQLATIAACLVAASIAAPRAAADYVHAISPGETLTSVAAQDGLTVAALAAANGLSPTAELIAGQTLQIPPQTGTASTQTTTYGTTSSVSSNATTTDSETTEEGAEHETTAATGSVTTSASYLVQVGDTLTAIAARDGTTVAALAALNGLNPNGTLLAGAALRLPAPGTTAVQTSSSSSAVEVSTTSPPVETSSSGGPPYPTHEFATAPEIAQIAGANGVPASLAQAIGWQESGFNNDEVSSAGAVGVMQITPSTWSWINQNLTGGNQLAPASAASNVTGGVLLLHALLADTGSESEAAAGYYQGLASVRQNGMYPSTQQYVNSVLALTSRFGGG
jgi:LysM repeat protein